MGRRTYESIGRPLPNRLNIVLSRSQVAETKNLVWAKNPSDALMLADFHSILNGNKEFFVIGGEKIYGLFLPLVNKIFLTEVDCGPISGDAKFDVDFTSSVWWQAPNPMHFAVSDKDEFSFTVACYIRRVQRARVADEQRILSEYPSLEKYLTNYEISDDVGHLSNIQLDMFMGESGVEEVQADLDAAASTPEAAASEPTQLDLFG